MRIIRKFEEALTRGYCGVIPALVGLGGYERAQQTQQTLLLLSDSYYSRPSSPARLLRPHASPEPHPILPVNAPPVKQRGP
jgi:hypothetical protein